MIENKTVFILGAGSSVTYGYPSGKELRRQICHNIIPKIESLKQHDGSFPYSQHDLESFVENFSRSSTNSIDLFLSRRKEFENIGKFAITLLIMDAEQKSDFREDLSEINQDRDWYSHLYNQMSNNLIEDNQYRQFSDNKISFITFNYDRSLEYFLYDSFYHSFATDEVLLGGANIDDDGVISISTINDVFAKIPIYHVYGKVAGLSWQGDFLEYGAKYNFEQINTMKDNIRVIYDRAGKTDDLRGLIEEAEKIFFLGFGYASENMEVLGINDGVLTNQSIYGTAYGYTEREINLIKHNIYSSIDLPSHDKPLHPDIVDFDCLGILREFL